MRFIFWIDEKVSATLWVPNISLGLRYTLRLVFWIDWKVSATMLVPGTRCTSRFRWIGRYMQPSRSQVYVAPYVFGGLEGTYNRSGLRYTSRLMFWVDKKVFATVRVPGTRHASCFGWMGRYLQPPRCKMEKWAVDDIMKFGRVLPN